MSRASARWGTSASMPQPMAIPACSISWQRRATALRLTVLQGLSLRQAAEQLDISAMSGQRTQKKAIPALR